ncbi:hypothetical protein [Sediminibacillus dalangtanensis]|uniref:hypothetical protein n=1 Tax=Sediminibacillus dalangtanensis TaxID=2729421 RepID=UPI001AE0B4DD|nr:hypothetical protein [Sediminibacillus dalangtanensis]
MWVMQALPQDVAALACTPLNRRLLFCPFDEVTEIKITLVFLFFFLFYFTKRLNSPRESPKKEGIFIKFGKRVEITRQVI